MGYEEYVPDIYETTRGEKMRFPDPPEDGKFVFYNLHLPGTNNHYGTPVGVVALLVSKEHLDFIARGVAIRSLYDKWDVREGRIRAAGRALRAYNKHQAGQDNTVMTVFDHEHPKHILGMHNLGIIKSVVPAALTLREENLLKDKHGIHLWKTVKPSGASVVT
ncbi:MAG: hypothetical protein KAR39_07550 [Thermoplasmata archaeon]|nr:hypothetical protein [Thermoplasmata archaeon]